MSEFHNQEIHLDSLFSIDFTIPLIDITAGRK